MSRAGKEAEEDFINSTAWQYKEAYNLVDDDDDFSVTVTVPKDDSCWNGLALLFFIGWSLIALI